MQQGLKERLVGAAVLVVIAVIFIPMLLTDPIDSGSITKTNIPKRPAEKFNSKRLSLNESLKPMVKDKNAAIANENKTHAVIATEKEEPNIKDDKLVKPKAAHKKDVADKKPDRLKKQSDSPVGLTAWVVQLGSFSKKLNADKLNVNLRKAGFPAFVESLTKDGKISYRVRVGPEILRTDADALLKKIKSKMQLDGIVLSSP